MGTIITLKENLFKTGNKISRTPTYPLNLKKLEIIENYKIKTI